MFRLVSLVIAVSLAASAFASAQSTQPADTAQRVHELVQQLGSEEFSKREAAHAELRAMGARAKEGLDRGAESDNPEIRDRCRSLLDQLAGHGPVESAPAAERRMTIRGLNVGPAGVAGNVRVQMIGPAGGRQAMRNENGRVVSLVEDAEGITLTIREPRDGKLVEETITAATPEELKHKNVEAYEEYEKFGPAPVPPGAMGKGIAIDGEIRALIEERFREIDNAQRVAEQLADNILRQMDQDVKLLQQKLREQGLPGQADLQRLLQDRGRMEGLLPGRADGFDPDQPVRPARGLGVLVNDPDEMLTSHLGKGLVVERVLPGSVAEQAGIERFDFIKRINGREIGNVTELRESLEIEGKKSIELLRKGEKKIITIE